MHGIGAYLYCSWISAVWNSAPSGIGPFSYQTYLPFPTDVEGTKKAQYFATVDKYETKACWLQVGFFPYTYLNKDPGEAKAMQLIQNETVCAIYVQVRWVITYGYQAEYQLI